MAKKPDDHVVKAIGGDRPPITARPRSKPGERSPIVSTAEVAKPTKKAPMRVSRSAIARMKRSKKTVQFPTFTLPKLMPGVVKAGEAQHANDSQIDLEAGLNSVSSMPIHGMWAEGIGFMGYPYLAMLSQRSEYRQPVEVLAEEMTRKWIDIKAEGKDKAEEVQALNDSQEKFHLRASWREGLELDGTFGLAFLYIDLWMPDKTTPVFDNPEELLTPLTITPDKIGKDMLRGFKPIDPTWVAPNIYDAVNPMSDTFYKPQVWWIMGRQVHASRLITIISRPVPQLLKPAYNFGGISLLQMMKPYVDNWLSTRQAVNDLINAFTVWKLSTNMEAVLQDPVGSGMGGEEAGAGFEERITLFADTMNNRGVMAIDKDTEELDNISAPLGSLDKLQAQAQEHMAAPARVPLVKLFGITPSGLNASSDGEIRTFYDSVHGMQQRVMNDGIGICLRVIQLSETGTIDEELTHEFVELWQLDRAGQAAAEKTEADTDAVLIAASIISPDEARTRIASADGPYSGLEGEAPEAPDLSEEMQPDDKDDADKVANAGANGEEGGANSGV